MNIHEILTLLGLFLPLAYVLGRFDEKYNPEAATMAVALIVFALTVISSAVAITLRIVG